MNCDEVNWAGDWADDVMDYVYPRQSPLFDLPLDCKITGYHDFVAMNSHEIIFDPNEEESTRILNESVL